VNEDLRTEKEKMIDSLHDIFRDRDDFERFYERTRRYLDDGEKFSMEWNIFDKDCESIRAGYYLEISDNHELRKKLASFLQVYAIEFHTKFEKEIEKAIEASSKLICKEKEFDDER